MTSRNSMLVSAGVHLAIFLVLILGPMAELRPPKERFVPIDITAFQEPAEQPEPEPEPPKEEPKPDDETVTDMQEKVATPRPTPTTKPTRKPTPTNKPTLRPTQRPTLRPTLTPMPTSTPLPTMLPTLPNEIRLTDEIFNKPQENSDGPSISIAGEHGTDYDFDSYARRLSVYLKRNWNERALQRRPEQKEFVTEISFTIERDGSIYDVMIETSSGWDLMDKTVADAVLKTDQELPLPFDYSANTIRARFPFVLTLPENQRP